MYRKAGNEWEKHLDFILLDFLCLELSFIAATLVRNNFVFVVFSSALYRSIMLVLFLIDVVLTIPLGAYKNVLHRDAYQEIVKLTKQTITLFLILALYLTLTKMSGGFSRIVFVLTAGIYFASNLTVRILLKKKLEKQRTSFHGASSLLIISKAADSEEITRTVITQNYEKYDVKGIVLIDEERTGSSVLGIPVVADASSVLHYLGSEWVDEVIINLPFDSDIGIRLSKAITEMGIVLHRKITSTENIVGRRQFIEKLGSTVFLTTSMNVMSGTSRMIKRTADIIIGAAGCIATGLLLLVFGPIIYFKSPGSVIFKQQRVGRNGKRFQLYKIRSMYLDAEQRKAALMTKNMVQGGLMFKMENDPRIIGSERGSGKGIGNFIRKYSIDEFPQFFNILKGDMSFIGTRPPTEEEWEHYKLHHRSRLAIKPGLTGMWQVSGRSSITNFEEVVKLDQQYINEWSLALDLKIFAKTFRAIFRHDGAM